MHKMAERHRLGKALQLQTFRSSVLPEHTGQLKHPDPPSASTDQVLTVEDGYCQQLRPLTKESQTHP